MILSPNRGRWWQRNSVRSGPDQSCLRRPRSRATTSLYLEALETRRLLSGTSAFDTALPLVLNSPPQLGTLQADPNYYAFSVIHTGRLIAEVAPIVGAARLSLLASDGSVLMQSDGQSASNPNDRIEVNLSGSNAGTSYFLEVQGLDHRAGTYLLTTTYLPASAGQSSTVAGNAPTSGPLDPALTRLGTNPIGLASADINDDGKLDLVTANPLTRNITIALGHGDGTFATPASIPFGGEPVALVSGDFNHDGRPDLAVADFQNNTISILLGVGDGTFDASLAFTVGSQPDALVLGDFNQDGIPDLAVANFGSGSVSVLLGKGDGTFLAGQQLRVGDGPVALAVGDVNGDGHADLVVASSGSPTLSVLEGSGRGTFQLTRMIPLEAAPSALVTGDFNNDGSLDIALADPSANAISVLLGQGDGGFQAPQSFATGSVPRALIVGDFNGDHQLDLASADSATQSLTILLGQGNGTFQAGKPVDVGLHPFALLAADLNGDGRRDLATADGQSGAVVVRLGLGDGLLVPPGPSFPPAESAPIVADFNGDGIPDVVSLREDGAILFRAGRAGQGTFEAPIVINPDPAWAARRVIVGHALGTNFLFTVNARDNLDALYAYFGGAFVPVYVGDLGDSLPSLAFVGDVNGDGLNDLVVASAATGNVFIALQREHENFSERDWDYQFNVGPGISNLTLADLNGDGLPDILVTNQVSGEVTVVLNAATDPYSTQLHFRAGLGVAQVATDAGAARVQSTDTPIAAVVGQFDRGGLPELAVLNRVAQRVELLPTDGYGGLLNSQPEQSFPTGLDPNALVMADFNGDGITDLAVLNRGSQDVTILLGNGRGGFTQLLSRDANGQPASLRVGDAPTGLTVTDFDRDGIPDLVVGNARGDVLVLHGNGDGTFQPYQRIDQHVALALAGREANSYPQFVFANQALDRITVPDGESGQGWQQDRQSGVLAPNHVQLADLNGDGIADLIVTNGGGNDILVYPGLGDGRYGLAQVFFVGTNPTGLTLADVNGDGLPDLVVTNEGSNDVSILFSQGKGSHWTLTNGPRLRVGAGPVEAVVEDVTGDGIPDLVVANSQSNDVYLLPGVGHGFFDDRDPVIFPTGEDPVHVFVGQFDEQPELDLITLNAASHSLTFFPGFGAGKTLPLGPGEPVEALAGDFEHRGTSDLLVASDDGNFFVFRGSARGSLDARLLPTTGPSNISDMVLGEDSGETMTVYVTTLGQEVAIPLMFVFDAPHEPTLSEALFAVAPGQPVAEFSSLSGTGLELLTTLMLSSHDAGTLPESSPELATAASVDSSEDESAEGIRLAALEEVGGSVARNALITGVLDLPLSLEAPSTVEVPFRSPLDWFTDRSQPLGSSVQQAVAELSRWTTPAKTELTGRDAAAEILPALEQGTGSAALEWDGPNLLLTPADADPIAEWFPLTAAPLESQHETEPCYGPSAVPEQGSLRAGCLVCALGLVMPLLIQEGPVRPQARTLIARRRRP